MKGRCLMVYLSGRDVQRLMRRAHCTIRALSWHLGIPMTRIRMRRKHGIDNPHVARDWVEAITGKDPGPL